MHGEYILEDFALMCHLSGLIKRRLQRRQLCSVIGRFASFFLVEDEERPCSLPQ